MNKKWKIVLAISLLANLSVIYVAIKALEYRSHINEWLEKYNNVVDEFSERQYYYELNKLLVSDTTIPNRVVFFGTQVTAGWDLEDNFHDYETINRGVPGQRVSGLLLRFRPDVIDLGPEAAIIEISSYNLRETTSIREICDYVISLIELASVNGIRPIPATMIPPCRDSLDLGEYRIMDSVKLFNGFLSEYCRNNGHEFIDFNGILADSGGFLQDKYASGAVDLNETGYKLISREVNRLLRERN